MRRRLAAWLVRGRWHASRRCAAWLVCGPVGHAWAGVADWLELFIRWRWARLRGRDGHH